ncbi:MAG: FCD domain-containing protein [Alicyclobacillus sp.]|nr:FCD domain-containing protein [Alicyclobacillus sp.]
MGKLVRQGIITMFPWRKYGFEVVCDAGSGEKALELLDKASLFKQLAVNLQQHRVIAQAIADGQPEAAQQAIAEHFASLEVSMLPDTPATDEAEEEEDDIRNRNGQS